jgi:hypothetical protein
LQSGDSSIDRRRPPRKQEFNPFAKDAQQQARRRRDERDRQAGRRPPAPTEAPETPKQDVQADFLRKQAEAREKLVQKGDVSAPAVQPAAVNHTVRAEQKPSGNDVVRKQSREDRLAELRRKSEELKKNAAETVEVHADAESIAVVVEPVESTVLVGPTPSTQEEIEPVHAPTDSEKLAAAHNVFKKIETKVKPKDHRGRKRRRFDKTGGGRQKAEKLLNRQKYLEYKYAAKDILNNPDVAEEHRSNVLGQIWAKGERIGVDESHAFIEQKVEELILTETVANELRQLVNRMTTRR